MTTLITIADIRAAVAAGRIDAAEFLRSLDAANPGQ